MIINDGEKFHVAMRRMYEGQLQRHFAGQVESPDGKDFLLDINEFSTRR